MLLGISNLKAQNDIAIAQGGRDTHVATSNGIATIKESAAKLALPFTETFETWPLANWTIEGTSAYVWEQGDGTASGPYIVPEGQYAAMFNVYYASSGSTTTMTSELIDMSSESFPELSFQYWMDGDASADLWIKVEMSIDGTTWTEIFKKEQDGTISDWTEVKLYLTGANATTQVRITGSSNYGSYNIFVDKLKIEGVDYPAPLNLEATNLTSNSADISWTELGTATQWNLKVASSSIDPETGTGDIYDGQVTPTAQYSLSNLDPITKYYVYVQANHGSGNFSEWSSEFMFETLCEIVSEFSENFDNLLLGAIPQCWNGIKNGGYFGVNPNYPLSGINSMYAYNGGIFITPEVSNVDDETHQLTFYAMSGYNSEAVVEVGYLTNVDDASSFNLLQTFNVNETYEEYIMQPDNTSGAVQRLAFRVSGNAVYFDDISWAEIPSCPKPVDLAISNITASSAEISWTESGSASQWNLKVSTTPIDPTLIAGDVFDGPITTKPYVLTNLDASTNYYVYIQADCTGGDVSVWSKEATFATLCSTFTVPYTQGFEGESMPMCWSILDENSDDKKWEILSASVGPHGGATVAGIGYNSAGNNDWLITPEFEINDDNIEFEFYASSRDNELKESFNVLISTTGNEVADFTTTLENVVDVPAQWTKYSYKLSDYGVTSGQTVYVAIQCVSVNKFNLYVDDFSIKVGEVTTNPQVNQIDINNAVQNMSVCKGTSEDDVKASLASEIVITDTNNQEYTVGLTWTIDSYDANITGDYNATGTFTLPTGVDQTDPATDLEVTTVVTVSDAVDPTFSFATEYCFGATPDALPTTSVNAIEGTWVPATISTDAVGSADYTFTPTNLGCASEVIVTVNVSASVAPTFDFATTYCAGVTADALPTTSNNLIEGTWSPATISTDAAGSTDYTFTPNDNQCASAVTVAVTVNAATEPTFDFATTYCVGATAEALPTTSSNGVEGTWSPATISTDVAGSTDYTFTPNVGQGCVSAVTIAVTVNAATEPTFDFATSYCVGATAEALPTTSSNSIEGTWSPATISTDAAGSTDYTFTPNDNQCASAVTVAVTVNAATEPTFDFATEYCVGATAEALPTTSSNGVEGTWSPAIISTDAAGSTDYTFTPNDNQCASVVTVTVTVNELPVVTCPDDMTVTTKAPVAFAGQTPEGGTFSGTGVVGNTFVADGLDNGTYVVTYTYTNDSGCENSCEFNVVVNLPIGVTAIASNDIKVYPNPSNGNFQIELSLKDSKEAELQIVNTLGEVVVRENITNTDSFVRNYNTKLQSGAYIIRIRLNDRIITKTLIVK